MKCEAVADVAARADVSALAAEWIEMVTFRRPSIISNVSALAAEWIEICQFLK